MVLPQSTIISTHLALGLDLADIFNKEYRREFYEGPTSSKLGLMKSLLIRLKVYLEEIFQGMKTREISKMT